MTVDDPYDLQRFLSAQEPLFDTALAELKAGLKQTHWMWFIFPQLRGLGRSDMAHHYGIASRAEAEAYLAHPVLGKRLVECTDAVVATEGRDLKSIFGEPDDMKFRSCMTLFAEMAGEGSVFSGALKRMCGGKKDPATLRLLGRWQGN